MAKELIEKEQEKQEVKSPPKNVVGISFRRCGKIYRFDAGDIEIFPGDWAVVETVRGLEMGQVLHIKMKLPEGENSPPLKSIIRIATDKDHERVEENRYLSAEAFRIGLDKIRKHGLPMKLVEVNYTLDQSKIVFYFSADGRVDFRALVRDLASVFHKRIELHQIGVRDVAKILGGIGPCGLTVCCATFLASFDPVSIKMAKEEGLSLNPVKISGTCGRLMCCLKYEHEQYLEAMKDLPPYDSVVRLPEGNGVVTELNVPKQSVLILMPSNARVEFPAEAFRKNDDGSFSIRKGWQTQKKKKKEHHNRNVMKS